MKRVFPPLRTSFHNDDVHVFPQDDATGHLQLLAVGFNFEAMRRIVEMSDAVHGSVNTHSGVLGGSFDVLLATLIGGELAGRIGLLVRSKSVMKRSEQSQRSGIYLIR